MCCDLELWTGMCQTWQFCGSCELCVDETKATIMIKSFLLQGMNL